MTTATSRLRDFGGHDRGTSGGAEQDERELAALGDGHGDPLRIPISDTEQTTEAVDQQGLDEQQADHAGEHGQDVVQHEQPVYRHANGDEEEAQEQATERLDVGFQLMPVLGIGQQHAGEKSAHGHGQPDARHDRGRADHQQERRCGEDLAGAGQRDDPEDGPEQVAADDHHGRDHADDLAGLQPGIARLACSAGAEQRDQCQQRHDGQVLEQQDGECSVAVGAVERSFLLEDLEREGRGGQGQAEAGDKRRSHRQAYGNEQRREHGTGDDHLRETEPEDVAPHHPKTRGLQLEPDDEQEQHHAEFAPPPKEHPADPRRAAVPGLAAATPTVLIQPNPSSIRLRIRWLTA